MTPFTPTTERIRLRDGSRATIRPIKPADKALIAGRVLRTQRRLALPALLRRTNRATPMTASFGSGKLERSSAEVRFEVALPERAGIGSALHELLRAVGAGRVVLRGRAVDG